MIRTILASVLLATALTTQTAEASETVDATAVTQTDDASDASAKAAPEGEASDAVAPPSALEAFKKSHETVLALIKAKAGDEALEKEVDALLDYEWIAQASLGGPARYEKKCAPRCAEFEERLAQLIRKNYLKRLSQSDSGSIEYGNETVRRNGTRAKVDTKVHFTKNGTKQSLEISYVMHYVNDAWVVRNIITDKVSMERTYKYDFAGILRDEGIDGLISRLENKLAEIAKG